VGELFPGLAGCMEERVVVYTAAHYAGLDSVSSVLHILSAEHNVHHAIASTAAAAAVTLLSAASADARKRNVALLLKRWCIQLYSPKRITDNKILKYKQARGKI